jgi:hypothetical protein
LHYGKKKKIKESNKTLYSIQIWPVMELKNMQLGGRNMPGFFSKKLSFRLYYLFFLIYNNRKHRDKRRGWPMDGWIASER